MTSRWRLNRRLSAAKSAASQLSHRKAIFICRDILSNHDIDRDLRYKTTFLLIQSLVATGAIKNALTVKADAVAHGLTEELLPYCPETQSTPMLFIPNLASGSTEGSSLTRQPKHLKCTGRIFFNIYSSVSKKKHVFTNIWKIIGVTGLVIGLISGSINIYGRYTSVSRSNSIDKIAGMVNNNDWPGVIKYLELIKDDHKLRDVYSFYSGMAAVNNPAALPLPYYAYLENIAPESELYERAIIVLANNALGTGTDASLKNARVERILAKMDRDGAHLPIFFALKLVGPQIRSYDFVVELRREVSVEFRTQYDFNRGNIILNVQSGSGFVANLDNLNKIAALDLILVAAIARASYQEGKNVTSAFGTLCRSLNRFPSEEFAIQWVASLFGDVNFFAAIINYDADRRSCYGTRANLLR